MKVATEMLECGGWIVRSVPDDEPPAPRTKTTPLPPAQLDKLLRRCR